MEQLLAHLVGDYLLQSHWMATTKTSKSIACFAHVVLYTIPFLFLTRSPVALVFIAGTHFVIDRWRLARYIIFAKNFLGVHKTTYRFLWGDGRGLATYDARYDTEDRMSGRPIHSSMSVAPPGARKIKHYPKWSDCEETGYPSQVPDWLSVWLLIITDNTLHLLCNYFAIKYL